MATSVIAKRSSRQRECDVDAFCRRNLVSPSACCDDDILLSIDHVCSRSCATGIWKLGLPQELARSAVKSVELAVIKRGTNEDQTASRHNGATLVFYPCIFPAFGH